MKKNYFSLLLIFSSLVLLLSCSDDEAPKKNNLGSFTFNEKTYPITEAFIVDDGQEGSVYARSLTFSDVTAPSSKFDYFVISILTDQPNLDIPEGIYTYGTSGSPLSWYYGAAIFDFTDAGNGDSYDIVDGSITVTKSSDNYTIVFDLYTPSGQKITGTFKGALKSN